MSSPNRFTYNIDRLSLDKDKNNTSYYTYNPNYILESQNQNQNNDIIYQSNDLINVNNNQKSNTSYLNQTSPIPFHTTYNNYQNLNLTNDNEMRFNRLNSRLEEINSKISKEKTDKEGFIHNKLTNTELVMKTYNETCLRKINEVKNDIKGLYNFFEQIKTFTKKNSEETDQILDSFENKFNARIKEEENKRINLEKKLNNLIDTKIKDMKYKINEKTKDKSEEQEELKNKLEEKLPQVRNIVDDERKQRIIKDEEIKEKIKEKMNYYNDIMKKEIKNRENFDEQILDTIKSSFAEFNKQMRQTTFNREQNEGQLIDLVDATISQFEANGNIIIDNK